MNLPNRAKQWAKHCSFIKGPSMVNQSAHMHTQSHTYPVSKGAVSPLSTLLRAHIYTHTLHKFQSCMDTFVEHDVEPSLHAPIQGSDSEGTVSENSPKVGSPPSVPSLPGSIPDFSQPSSDE